ncbi:hypothetical protein [Acetivibrio clariflavus]|nr:hypothetical protein [Acetivibrio clariflavus]
MVDSKGNVCGRRKRKSLKLQMNLSRVYNFKVNDFHTYHCW